MADSKPTVEVTDNPHEYREVAKGVQARVQTPEERAAGVARNEREGVSA